MNTKINAVIFDMDGVLVDSEHAMKQSSIMALKKYGIDAKDEDFNDFIGMGEDMFVGGVARKYGVEYLLKMKDEAYEIYIKTAKESVFVFPGVKDLLIKLKETGYKIAVASAADLIKVKTNLSCIGLDVDFFNAVVSGSEVKNKKPHPEIFIKTADKIGIPYGECIVIEDALSGIKAAKDAGMKSIAVETSFDEKTLKSANPDYIIKKIGDSYDIITKL